MPYLTVFLSLIFVSCLCISPSLTTADDVIHVKPKLCIKKKMADFCDIDVDIHWRASSINHYCIVNKTDNITVGCWKNVDKGKSKNTVHTQIDLIYVLMHEEENRALVSQALQVLSLDGDSQRKKRRRRHIWSLF